MDNISQNINNRQTLNTQQQVRILPQQQRRPQSTSSTTNRSPRVISYRLFNNRNSNQIIQYNLDNDNLFGGIDFISANPLLGMIFGQRNQFQGFFQRHHGDQQFENLLNLIMQNDPNRYGTPPASEKSIDELKKELINDDNHENYSKNECSICKDNYKKGEVITIMPCEHVFHDDCLIPWLKRHNSCPVCRYELATQDPDYEARKAHLRRSLNNQNLEENTRHRSERRSSHSTRNGQLNPNNINIINSNRNQNNINKK